MEKDGSLPPVRFDRRFDKPPQQRQDKKRNSEQEPEQPSFAKEPRQHPPDPENPSSIDITA